MKMILGLTILFSLSSCFEIIEELDLKKDHSGDFTYTLNMSASRLELNTILKLDSFKGRAIPSAKDISADMDKAILLIRQSSGINKAVYTKNWEDYIFEFKISFDSLAALDRALNQTYQKLSKSKEPLKDRLLMANGLLKRTSRLNRLSWFKKLNSKEVQDLSKANYTCVYRFQEKIKSQSNTHANTSKNGMASLLKSDIKSLLKQQKSVANTIKF
ncbi:MAG: hypothetical protein P8O20_06720 [Bacteroidia bacterium]|nr:hypothetical protein [Bacteroidia bacterium]